MKKTKKDEPATKEDLKKNLGIFKKEVITEFAYLHQNFLTKDEAARYYTSQQEFNEMIREIKETMLTRDEFYTYMDSAMTEIRASRCERELFETQRLRTDDQVQDHEKRITKLEKTAA